MAPTLVLLLRLGAMVMVMVMIGGGAKVVGVSWCVARSNASEQSLQTALDYACGSGADCAPLLSTGLCFLPNTIQAHASYAFDSYYQRKLMAPGSCDFSGTATIATTDPSYGSCVYPSTPRSAGGGTPPVTPTPTMPTIDNPDDNSPMVPTTTTPIYNGGVGGLNPGLGPPTPSPATSQSSLLLLSLILLLLYLFHPI